MHDSNQKHTNHQTVERIVYNNNKKTFQTYLSDLLIPKLQHQFPDFFKRRVCGQVYIYMGFSDLLIYYYEISSYLQMQKETMENETESSRFDLVSALITTKLH